MCGVCGGDNLSCVDCANIPNGDAEIDCCGDCDGSRGDKGGYPNKIIFSKFRTKIYS